MGINIMNILKFFVIIGLNEALDKRKVNNRYEKTI